MKQTPSPYSDVVAGMREGREAAYTEFVRRWQPLLSDGARRLGLSPDDADDLVADVLVEAASAFGAGRAAPREMGAYLMTALRNRARNHWRDEARRRARETAAYAEATDGGAIAALGPAALGPAALGPAALGTGADGLAGEAGAPAASTVAVRERAAPPAPPAPDEYPCPPPPLARLAEALTRGLSRDERMLLVWSGHHVPHRTIAEWLGSNPGAVSKRLERLRARLRRAAMAHLEDVSATERAMLVRFLRRADQADVDAPARAQAPASSTRATSAAHAADPAPSARAPRGRSLSSRSGEE